MSEPSDKDVVPAEMATVLLDALDAMDEGPDAVEALHHRLWGEDPSQALEQALLAGTPSHAGEGEEGPTAVPSAAVQRLVSLSFRQARGEAGPVEAAELEALERELETKGGGG